MTTPLDPNSLNELGNSEYSWGKGMFPPGVADNERQTKFQDDFGSVLPHKPIGDKRDNYARAVADRRTDPCDAESNRSFETLGNVDRFGAAPPLVRDEPEKNVPATSEYELPKTPRAW